MTDDKVADLSARRWNEDSSANDHSPIDALKAAIRDIEAGVPIDHVIVFMGQRNDGGPIKNGFKQAGNFNEFEQIGLMRLCTDRVVNND